MLTLSSITKKQTVALTGLLLILFLIVHLAGNLTIYFGPEAFNGYAHKLHSLGVLLWVPRILLLIIFLTHVILTASLVIDNIRARTGLHRYAVDQSVGKRSWFTRLMPFTGSYIFLFIIWHILDFTMMDQSGPRSYINGISFGIYGVVKNALSDPMHAGLYIIAMCFLGMHLSHGVKSYQQTMGWRHPIITPLINRITVMISWLLVLGFSSIPLFILYSSK